MSVMMRLKPQWAACLIACIRPTLLSCANSISTGNERRGKGAVKEEEVEGGSGRGRG